MLTESGHRDSRAEEDVVAAMGAQAVTHLVSRRRLLHKRGTKGNLKRIELTHDLLIPVVRASRTAREERLKRQSAERQKQAAIDATAAAEKEREEALKREQNERNLKRASKVFAGGMLVLAVISGFAMLNALKMEKRAKTAEQLAAKNLKIASSWVVRNTGPETKASAVAFFSKSLREVQDANLGHDSSSGLAMELLANLAFGSNYRLLQKSLPHDGNVNALALGSQGRFLVTGCSDSLVRVWDLQSESQSPMKKLGLDGEVYCVAIHPIIENWIVGGGAEGRLAIWQRDGEVVKRWKLETGADVLAVRFSADGNWLVATTGTNGVTSGRNGFCLGRQRFRRASSSPLKPSFSTSGRR